VTIRLLFILVLILSFMKRTKHTEVDYQFIRENIVFVDIKSEFVNSCGQLGNIFIKSLRRDLKLIIFVTSLVHMTYMH